jgi:hypothetical protein
VIAQVFRDILENAIVACHEPGGIVIRGTERAEKARPVAIRDNGPHCMAVGASAECVTAE